MKKSAVALATFTTLAAFGGLAQAQSSITLYGIVDAGVESFTNQDNNSSRTRFSGNGGELPNLWGLKGSEDLGGGTKAIFNLEGSMNVGSGQGTSTPGNMPLNSNGGLFGRQAFVGLSGGWGTVKLGLQEDPAFLSMVATDPRGGKQSFSGLQTWINSTKYMVGLGNVYDSSSPVQTTTLNIFDQNAISYGFNGYGFDVGVLYALGGTSGGSSHNSLFSAGGTYKNGGLVIGVGTFHDQTNGPIVVNSQNNYTYTNVTEYNVGAGYSWSDWTVKGYWMDVKPNRESNLGFNNGLAGIDEYQTIGIGGSYKWSNALSFNAAYYATKDQTLGGHVRMVALGLDYELSKRTGLYALYGSSRNGGGNGFGDSTVPGTGSGATLTQSGTINQYGMTSNGVVLGLNHKF